MGIQALDGIRCADCGVGGRVKLANDVTYKRCVCAGFWGGFLRLEG